MATNYRDPKTTNTSSSSGAGKWIAIAVAAVIAILLLAWFFGAFDTNEVDTVPVVTTEEPAVVEDDTVPVVPVVPEAEPAPLEDDTVIVTEPEVELETDDDLTVIEPVAPAPVAQ